MTDHEYTIIGWLLITIAWLWLSVAIAGQVIQHVREERGRKPRPLPGALGASMEARIAETWPEWSDEPIYGGMVAETWPALRVISLPDGTTFEDAQAIARTIAEIDDLPEVER